MKLSYKIALVASALTLATGIAASTASATTGPAAASTAHHTQSAAKVHPLIPTGLFPIVTNLDGMCLSADGGNGTAVPGEGVDIENCVPGGSPYQEWTYNAVNGNLISAVNSLNNLCLDDRFDNPTGGAGLDLFNCNTWAAQDWSYTGEWLNNNMCLDVINKNTFQGAGVQLYSCGNSPSIDTNQYWHNSN